MPPNSKNKLLENVFHIFFENLVVEFINIARILRVPEMVKYHSKLFVNFSIPIVTYKLTPPISTKFFNFNKFLYDLGLHFFKQTQIV